MRRNIFALCDLEVAYAYNFMEYLNQKKNIPFEVHAFTSVEQLEIYTRDHPVEILLISDKAMCEQVKDMNIQKLIILSEGVHDPRLDQYPSVYKYQSSDAVIREVMACYGAETTERPASVLLKKETKIVAVYSPIGRCLKTSFALTMGQLLAKERATLYLNLEEYAGFEDLFHTTYERNLSDILYYIRQENTNLIHKLNSMVQTVNNLDYLPPVLSPEDIRSTTYDEWTLLLDTLRHCSNYETIIIDMGDGVDGLYNLLEQCDAVYMPVKNDVMSTAKIRQFENLLRMWDCVPVLEKIQKLKLPYHGMLGGQERYVEQLMWSELGDFVREQIRKDHL
ncbi:MAG: hypothetical protein PHS82_12855 [Lachnospiraceae bacterium]|nr:hypothetical protein [Lachnospiraceae bacterium]